MRQRRVVIAMLCGVVIAVGAVGGAAASCGDGVVDGTERCDHGAANGTDGCCSAACQLIDVDGDGLCDAVDSCAVSSVRGLMKEPRLSVTRVDRPVGEQAFRVRGTLIVRPPGVIDPATDGLRLTFHYFVDGDVLFDAIAAGGPGWNARTDGSGWTYRRPAGDMGGITRAVVRRVGLPAGTYFSPGAEAFAFTIEGQHTTYCFDTEHHLIATISLDAGALNGFDCADAFFGPSVPWQCTPSSNGRTVTCGARRVGPCHVSDPNDMVVCDVLHAVEAEERYFAQYGEYHTGKCTELPGFVPSPGVDCSTGAQLGSFTVLATNPLALWQCGWYSAATLPNSQLTCS